MAAMGAALGLRDVLTLKGECPGLKFLRAIDDETANAADVAAFEAIAAVNYSKPHLQHEGLSAHVGALRALGIIPISADDADQLDEAHDVVEDRPTQNLGPDHSDIAYLFFARSAQQPKSPRRKIGGRLRHTHGIRHPVGEMSTGLPYLRAGHEIIGVPSIQKRYQSRNGNV